LKTNLKRFLNLIFLIRKIENEKVVTGAYNSYKAAVIGYRALPNKYLFTIFKIEQRFNIFSIAQF